MVVAGKTFVQVETGAMMSEQCRRLSHDLNQPLTALILYLRAAERAIPNDGTAKFLAEVMQKAIVEAERAIAVAKKLETAARAEDA
jgi:two-component system sensor kinase FixL